MATNLKNKCGISPIIGVILIIALTVALVSILTFLAFNISDDTSDTPNPTITLSDDNIQLIRSGNTESVIIQEGGVPDYELSVGDNYKLTSEYEVRVIGIIDGQKTLITYIDGENISSRHNTEPEDTQEIFDDLDGDGSDGNPYIITNDYELQAVQEEPDAYYELGNNIDAAGTPTWNNDTGFEPIDAFEGNLEGNDYVVVGLTIDRPDETNVGLIRNAQGEIQNMGIINADITGDENVGSLIGRNSNHIHINQTHSTGDVSGNKNVGGLIGLNHNHATINQSYSSYDVEGIDNVGGIIGRNNNHAEIYNSYSNGTITGVNKIGGIVGNNNNHGNIYTSYATGSIIGETDVGGLVGNVEGHVEDSYWDIESTGVEERNEDKGTGLLTGEMIGENAENNMDGFNFDNIWNIQENNYPKLHWEDE